jgi:hypothetical protein
MRAQAHQRVQGPWRQLLQVQAKRLELLRLGAQRYSASFRGGQVGRYALLQEALVLRSVGKNLSIRGGHQRWMAYVLARLRSLGFYRAIELPGL